MRLDNIAPVKRENQKVAAGMLDFIERGEAIIALPTKPGYIEMHGGLAFYRAIAGDLWPAKIVDYYGGACTLDVIVRGVEEPVRLRGIPIH